MKKSLLAVAAITAIPAFAFAGPKDDARGAERVNPLNTNTGASIDRGVNAAEATYSPAPFSLVVTAPVANANATLLTGIPAGTYTSFSVSVDWSVAGGDPWSDEAIWALTDAPLATATTFYADPGPASNAAANGSPVTLTWNGFFDIPYTAPTNGSLYFLSAQTFTGSSANWNNITITLSDATITPPPSIPTTLGGSISTPIAPAQIIWYSFEYTGGALNLDTAGSTLTASTLGDENDTEMALFSSTGALIAANDDVNFGAGILTSALSFDDGELAPGTYYLAVGGFNSTFGSAFGASSTAIQSGKIIVNGLSLVPEPATLGLLAGLSLLGLRRR